MSVARSASRSAPRTRSPILGASKLLNPLVLLFAGTRLMPLYGVLEHRGRRSGKTFRTPVVVRPTSDGFIVPMPWGESTDWYRNVRAAGECVIRWKGRKYALVQPVVIDAAAARDAFDPTQQSMMARFGIKQALRLRHRDLMSS